MTAAEDDRERAVLRLVKERYESDGYEVFLHPSPTLLPPAIRDYQPDAVAVGPEDTVVIEVKSGSLRRRRGQLRQVAAELAKMPKWRFVILSAEASDGRIADFEPPTLNAVEKQ